MPYYPLPFPSGGSGAVTIAWGPDFGGADGDGFEVTAAVTVDDMAATYEILTATAAVSYDAAITLELLTASTNLDELVYAADYNQGADSAVNDGPDNWTTPGSATGQRDGTETSRVGQLLASTDANMRLGYADPAGGIQTFTLTLVQLRYDTRQTGTVLNNGGLHHEYRLDGGAWVSLEIFTGDINNDPIIYDITSAVGGDWAKINALEVRVRAVLGIGTNLVTCFCDAVELRFLASLTVTNP